MKLVETVICEMSAIPGYHPHRSFWVAKQAIKGFSRRGRQGEIELINGTLVPVSRTKTPSLQKDLM